MTKERGRNESDRGPKVYTRLGKGKWSSKESESTKTKVGGVRGAISAQVIFNGKK